MSFAEEDSGPDTGEIGDAIYSVTRKPSLPPDENMDIPKNEEDIPYPHGEVPPPEEEDKKYTPRKDDGERDRLKEGETIQACHLCASLMCPQFSMGLGFAYYDERCTGDGAKKIEGCQRNMLGCRECRIPSFS